MKLILDNKTGQLLGAHMIGAGVTELVQGYVVAMNLETTEEELMRTVFRHPALSEPMHEAVLDAYGRALNTRTVVCAKNVAIHAFLGVRSDFRVQAFGHCIGDQQTQLQPN